MTLVDTSLWIEHLRRSVPALAALLESGQVLMHPFVLGEIACGHLRNRRQALALLGTLPLAPMASDDEALALIEQRSLMGKGLGYVDVHLLASAALAHTANLWTRDRALAAAADSMGIARTDGARKLN